MSCIAEHDFRGVIVRRAPDALDSGDEVAVLDRPADGDEAAQRAAEEICDTQPRELVEEARRRFVADRLGQVALPLPDGAALRQLLLRRGRVAGAHAVGEAVRALFVAARDGRDPRCLRFREAVRLERAIERTVFEADTARDAATATAAATANGSGYAALFLRQLPSVEQRRQCEAMLTAVDVLFAALPPFRFPVTNAQAPGYSTVVDSPVSFATLYVRVRVGAVRDTAAFQRQLQVMAANCKRFNGDVLAATLGADRLLLDTSLLRQAGVLMHARRAAARDDAVPVGTPFETRWFCEGCSAGEFVEAKAARATDAAAPKRRARSAPAPAPAAAATATTAATQRRKKPASSSSSDRSSSSSDADNDGDGVDAAAERPVQAKRQRGKPAAAKASAAAAKEAAASATAAKRAADAEVAAAAAAEARQDVHEMLLAVWDQVTTSHGPNTERLLAAAAQAAEAQSQQVQRQQTSMRQVSAAPSPSPARTSLMRVVELPVSRAQPQHAPFGDTDDAAPSAAVEAARTAILHELTALRALDTLIAQQEALIR